MKYHSRWRQNLAPRKAKNLTYITRSYSSVIVLYIRSKDDRQSQWEMAKFGPQPTLNPLSDRHQMWNMWLRRGCLLPKKIWAQSAQEVFDHIREMYTQSIWMFTSLFLLATSTICADNNNLKINRALLIPGTNTMSASRWKRIVEYTYEVDLVAIFSLRMYLTSTYSFGWKWHLAWLYSVKFPFHYTLLVHYFRARFMAHIHRVSKTSLFSFQQ